MFETAILTDVIYKIYSFSDIHADFDSLLIALRDCAKVIVKKKKNNMHENIDYIPGIIDKDAHQLCNIDIRDEDNGFVDDFNYDWNPDARNVYVVIIGDILDGSRNNNVDSNDGFDRNTNYKPQIEIKILRFINSLMMKSRVYKSRLIKLLGNHEIWNINGSVKYDYLFTQDITIDADGNLPNYYRGINRINIFKRGNIGYDLLMQNGNGIMVKINNNIFIHGQLILEWKMTHYSAINNFLNNPTENIINPFTNTPFVFEDLIKILSTSKKIDIYNESPLWKRTLGNHNNINERLTNPETKVPFCIMVKNLLKTMATEHNEDITSLRLVIGHCTQYDSSISLTNNRSYTKVVLSDDKRIEYILPPANEGIPNTSTNFIFGITMECNKELPLDTNDHYLYRVDVGSSRGFDSQVPDYLIVSNKCDMEEYKKFYEDVSDETLKKASDDCESNPNQYVYNEKIQYGSRTPQVLEFSGYKLQTVRIIRSTIKNTRINQFRTAYECYAKNIPALNLDNPYYKKYLKYKNKYLDLKNKKL
jgi:hypothetical protein